MWNIFSDFNFCKITTTKSTQYTAVSAVDVWRNFVPGDFLHFSNKKCIKLNYPLSWNDKSWGHSDSGLAYVWRSPLKAIQWIWLTSDNRLSSRLRGVVIS